MIRAFYCLSLLFIGLSSNCQKLMESQIPDSVIENVKWDIYVFSYKDKLRKCVFKENRKDVYYDSSYLAVQCNIEIDDILVIADTIRFFYNFRKDEEKNTTYEARTADEVSGIGYLKNDNLYFVMNGETSWVYDDHEKLVKWNKYLQEKSLEFLNYIKTFKGDLCSFLKTQLLKRK